MKFIFFGTPEFASVILEKLIDSDFKPSAVVCNPDELVGRKQILTSPPVKILAEKNNIPVFQPKKLRSNLKFFEELKKINPNLMIVAAYGKMLPKEILDIPSFGTINVHPSLLPKYRGASPIQSAILNGDKETGVTIMKVDEEMDHGAILSKSQIPMTKSQNYELLSEKLAELGAELLIKTIPDYVSGKIKPVEQNHSEATYTKIINKEDGKIDWSKSAEEIEIIIRAYYPWPTAWTIWEDKVVKILEVKVLENNGDNKIGEIFLKNSELVVQCDKDSLIIKKLQVEGGRVLTANEFLNGHKDFIGSVLE
jgi:methionyl-tRNA formyltransferase